MMIEKLTKMEEKLVDCLSGQLDMGIEHVDTEEAYKVVDIIKDLAEAKYYCSITEAMEESEYGEDYTEKGRKFYNGNRMKRRYYSEPYDMQKSDMGYQQNESRYDRNRRYFTEAKISGQEDTQKLEHFLDTFQDDFTEMLPKMTPQEKQIAKQKFTAWAQKV